MFHLHVVEGTQELRPRRVRAVSCREVPEVAPTGVGAPAGGAPTSVLPPVGVWCHPSGSGERSRPLAHVLLVGQEAPVV
jgi:hypothetical protein